MANIIVRRYEHYNHAMGKYIRSKKHYEEEMAKGGYVPFEKAEQMAELARSKMHKDYNGLSPSTMKFINEVRLTSGRKGNIHISDRYVDGLKKHGVKVDCQMDKLPKAYQDGGFYNAPD